jgi:hypothetical protein
MRNSTDKTNYEDRSHTPLASRRSFLKMSLLGSGVLGVTLSGCSLAGLLTEDLHGRREIINNWLEAAKGFESTKFLDLHTQDVAFYSHQSRNPKIGQESLWPQFIASATDHLEEAFSFGSEETICIQSTTHDLSRSRCYLLVFSGDLIGKVYEYAGLHDLANLALSEERLEMVSNEDLNRQIEVVDLMTDWLNEGNFTSYLDQFHETSIMSGFLSIDPLRGPAAIEGAVIQFLEAYPNVKFQHYRTFGQGNFVCQQIIIEHGPVRSFCTVHTFEDDKIIRSFDYFSHAQLIDL